MLDILKVIKNITKVTYINDPERSNGHWVIEVCNPTSDYLHFTTEERADEAYAHLTSLRDKVLKKEK